MNTYTVTAENRFFWLTITVTADTQEAAETAFDAYIAKLNATGEEYDMMDQDANPEDFEYAYDDRHIEIDADSGDKPGLVRMINSGGNG